MRVSAWLSTSLLGGLLAITGCGVGEPAGPGGGDGSGGGGGDGSGGGGGGGGGGEGDLSGTITESRTLSGAVHLAADATIASGVELTIAAGSSFTGAAGAVLTVEGTLVVDGTADATVSMIPAEGADSWGGIVVESGGSATVRYATGTGVDTLMACRAGAATCALDRLDFQAVSKVITAASTATLTASRLEDVANGAVTVSSGGDITVSDSELMSSTHDILVASGGSLTVEYSTIGGTTETYEHCNFHVGSADSLVIHHSNIITGVYGMMIGNVDGAQVNFNNWQGNTTDVSPVGTATNADFTNNYWEKGAPGALGPGYDFSSPAGAPIADAGPRI